VALAVREKPKMCARNHIDQPDRLGQTRRMDQNAFGVVEAMKYWGRRDKLAALLSGFLVAACADPRVALVADRGNLDQPVVEQPVHTIVVDANVHYQSIDGWMLIMDGDPMTWLQLQYFFGAPDLDAAPSTYVPGMVGATHVKMTFPMSTHGGGADVAGCKGSGLDPGTTGSPWGTHEGTGQNQFQMLSTLGIPVLFVGNFLWDSALPSAIIEPYAGGYRVIPNSESALTAWGSILKSFINTATLHGASFWGISPQNEPDLPGNAFGVYVDPATYAAFLNGSLADAIAKSDAPGCKVIGGEAAIPTASVPQIVGVTAPMFRVAYHNEGDGIGNFPSPPVHGAATWETEMGGLDGAWTPSATLQMAVAMTRIASYHALLTAGSVSLVSDMYPYSSEFIARYEGGAHSSVGLMSPVVYGNVMQKKGWAFTHYSKFIRPGARRIDVSSVPSGVLASAYANTDGSIAIVAVNTNGTTTSLSVQGLGGGTSARRWVTDVLRSLAVQTPVPVSNGAATLSLFANSITTILVPAALVVSMVSGPP
jgi:hypothetical protein